MFAREWRGIFLDQQILVTNNWGLSFTDNLDSGAAKLYINGELLDTINSVLLSSNAPSLVGKILVENETHIVEVYMKSGLLKVKAKILVDGIKIAGDSF